ncbi:MULTISPECIES: adenylate/guanylate cyclase domain-containing protein [Ruegeria]|uniref:Adenylate/guanylate cyclase domain-containing protein n=1 Tax=Ruegeria atlantica TaxID=81569 RepID=A0ABX1WH77_9RHOB|nr:MULTISPECIES: adenylate/guanylate cyclase domain-containing protein [Ruegeria]NOD32690.1 adenylate/guanylate cyclase domain-containing protein [Ruegeria atlantica]
MRNARLIEAGVLTFQIAFLAAAIYVALKFSILAGALLFLGLAIGFTVLIYNYDAWLIKKLTSDEQPLAFSLCQSGFVGRVRRFTRLLPASPRCRLCLVPFRGFGKVLGIKPSSENPNFCRSCFEGLPTKTLDAEVGLLFADMRGFTPWSEEHSPAEAADMLTRFYCIAEKEIARDDALIEFIGDQVMAIYPVQMASLRERTADVMLRAAQRLLDSIKSEPSMLSVGIGINMGVAQVGEMATGSSRSFTAVGDVVNTAARLQSQASENEILLSEGVYNKLSSRTLDFETSEILLKGKSEAMRTYLLKMV